MKDFLSIAVFLCWIASAQAQNIAKMEYWIDKDPGFGAATSISGFPSAPDITAYQFTIPSNISPGVHTVGIRSQDDRRVWSHTSLFPLLVAPAPSLADIVKIEYFVDSDPGFNAATPVTAEFPHHPDITNFAFPLPATLPQGIHTICVRSKNADNRWSMTNCFPVYVADSSHGVITTLEYFWDSDPGMGEAIDTVLSIPVADFTTDKWLASVPMDIGLGLHTLFVRSKESNSSWSHTNHKNNIQVIGTVDVEDFVRHTGIKLYPNPFTDMLAVDPINNKPVRCTIYDARGRLIINTIIRGKTEFDTIMLTAGAYTCFIWMNERDIYKCMLIKQ